MSASDLLGSLAPRLLGYAGPADDPEIPRGSFAASVAVVLRPSERDHELLLIRRGESARDPWSGHMAFPGGRRDAADVSLLETARRETWEETGIPLAERGKVLGRLPEVTPLSKRLPPLAIVPFVFAVPAGTDARAASIEVADIHWVPLAHFRDPASRTYHRYDAGETILTFPAFALEGRTVWGLTHRILEDLITRLAKVPT
jgi:8-oxo-dGTP pyrophosphatase MutT (NUDIX family)